MCLLLILACIRPIASRRTPQQTAPSLHDVIAESTHFLSHELRRYDFVRSGSSTSSGDGDRIQLKQVVLNLLMNATEQ